MAEVQTLVEMKTDIQPENIPLPTPTNSMITVRLSDYGNSARNSRFEVEDEESTNGTQDDSQRDSIVSSPRAASIVSSQALSVHSSRSASISPVDWEVLEKTEEQEPRDEDTDNARSSTFSC